LKFKYKMGIGDWAQSPIPNPQSQIYLNLLFKDSHNFYININYMT